VSASPPVPVGRLRLALSAAYATNFGALAASGPFLAVHLATVGFSAPETAQLLAVLLLVRVVTIPAWTLLADRTNAMGGVLRIASAGALVTFAALLLAPGPALVVTCLLGFAAFRAPFGALLDALVLRDVRDAGGTFGAVRAWGTAGYALGAMLTGALVAREGSRAVIYVTTVLLAASIAAAWLIHARNATPNATPSNIPHADSELRSLGHRVITLLRRPRVLLLFAVASLQQMGLAPYDALFPAYLTKLAGATLAGTAVALGASVEFVFLIAGGRLVRRLGPERLLVLACAISTVRWGLVAFVTNAPLLVAIQALHAFGFGAFYLSSVLLMDQETPPSLRASGQGIFGSFAFGIAAAFGLSIAGLIERRAGMQTVFAFAAGASFLATLCASLLRARIWIREAPGPV
jgi:PPP family 3-phenylpropionic acid transporter